MGVPRIVIATANAGKAREIAAAYDGLPVEWSAMTQVGTPPDVEETGVTFAENARIKARAIAEWSGMPALSDDSGLVVDALDGAPGVWSARYAGPNATDSENISLLLGRMASIPDGNRTARFSAVVVLWRPDGTFDEVTGSCEGRIAFEESGDAGFGYDPVFVPNGYSQTFAELGADVKDGISHRAEALRRMRPLILGHE